MKRFDHEKLDVYQAAIEFVVLANDVVENLPRGRGYLADQLQRASTSIPLNVAEGAGEFSINEKARFYRIAKRSATESAAIPLSYSTSFRSTPPVSTKARTTTPWS